MYTKEKWIFIESNLSVVANGNNIAFTGLPRYVSEIRNDGESWLAMRNRTEPERKAIDEERKANAKLISAAPEMFEQLTSIIDGTAFDKETGLIWEHRLEEIRKVLNKAVGSDSF